ncbi:MAG TPA: PQQ-binding-like beta-propeller repeat protein [Pyrinomonadaceae bacterium]|jgi:outer membrane protein assembly factor BamB|nr:PQQ-binding-like beta-propeller repeat protein [Pyrinomonadaceae bacterium]
MSSSRLWSLILTLGTIILFTVPCYAQDWPQWRGPNRDGSAPALPAELPKILKEEWKVTVGVGHSSPVISKGKIYVFARQGEAETLLCLDAASGKEMWKSSQSVSFQMHEAATAHGKGPKSTPVIYKDSVFTLGISGVLSAYDARTGKLKWRYDSAKQYSKTWPLYGTAMSPIVDHGLVIAHVGGPDKGALIAFDADTGTVKWTNDMDGPAYASPILVTLAGARQVVTFMQKDFVGVDPATGKLLWKLPSKTEYDENNITAISYKDMLIFAREKQGLVAIRLAKEGGQIVPKQVWNNTENILYMSTPVMQGNTLLGFSVLKKGQFFALDAETGKTIWQGPGRMGENAALLNAGGAAFLALTNEGNLIVLPVNAKEYAPSMQYTVANSPTWAHPVVAGKHILIKDETTLRSLSAQ